MACQNTIFRFLHFPVSVLSCTISTEGREENSSFAFSPLAAACIWTILMKLISSRFRGELLQVHCVLLACARAAGGEFNVQDSKHMNPSIALASSPRLGFPWFQIQNVITDWLARDIVTCCIPFSRKVSKSLTINEPLKGNITYFISGWTHLSEVSECFLTSLLPVRGLKAKQRKAKNLP